MKKIFMGALVGVAALSLVACSDSATPVKGTTDKSDLTLEDVFNKAMDRQESLESLKAEIVMDQTIVMNEDGEELNMTSSTNMDMSLTTKPMAFYVDGVMSMAMADGSDALEIPLKMYLTEADGFYMLDMMSDAWLKLPDESYEEMLAEAGLGTDAKEQLEQLKPFLSDFTFEQNDSAYILTLNAKGEKFNDLILEQIEGTLDLDSFEEEGLSSMEDIKFENAKYIITIDKKTFDTTKIVMDFGMVMNIEGTDAKVSTVSTVNYSDFNKAEAITIPKDVIDNAIESEF